MSIYYSFSKDIDLLLVLVLVQFSKDVNLL